MFIPFTGLEKQPISQIRITLGMRTRIVYRLIKKAFLYEKQGGVFQSMSSSQKHHQPPVSVVQIVRILEFS
jgi:hypothetical protein